MVVKRTFRKRNFRRRPKRKLGRQFVAKVKRVISTVAEKKYWAFHNSQTVGSAGFLLHLSNIAQGDTDVTRDGDSLYVKSIQLNMVFALADTYNQCRVIVFQWHPLADLATATPLLSEILVDTATPTISPFAHDTRNSYRILADRMVILDADNPYKSFKILITKGFTRKIQYVSGSTFAQNNIFCFIVSDSGVAPNPNFVWSGKINYLDA